MMMMMMKAQAQQQQQQQQQLVLQRWRQSPYDAVTLTVTYSPRQLSRSARVSRPAAPASARAL